MNSLETKIVALLAECAALLKPSLQTASKLVSISNTKLQLKTVVDEDKSWMMVLGTANREIKSLPSFTVAEQSFKLDSIFSRAATVAGYWGTFPVIIQQLIAKSGRFHRDSVIIDPAHAIEHLRNLRKTLSAKHLRYEASVRLFGVNLTRRELSLPDDLRIVRLTKKERNERQPLLNTAFSSEWMAQRLLLHPVELQTSIGVPVDTSQEGALFKAQGNALAGAGKLFGKARDAILLTTSAHATLGNIEIKGGLEAIPQGVPLLPSLPLIIGTILRRSDLKQLTAAYELISKGKRTDSTLNRSLHYFLRGRRRSDLNDKLVDYVTAWEVLLLTQNGNAVKQELSYRFAVNGTSLVSHIITSRSPSESYRRMKAAYAIRSDIVHGSNSRDQSKTLKAGGFSNTTEVCEYLESHFRKVTFGLATLPSENRPYKKQGGWEDLLWPKRSV